MGDSRASKNLLYSAMGKTKYVAGKVGRGIKKVAKDPLGIKRDKERGAVFNARQAEIRKDRLAGDKKLYLNVK